MKVNLIFCICVFAYFTSLVISITCFAKLRIAIKPLPKLALTCKGIVFYSCYVHKIFIEDAKILVLDKTIYLKKGNTIIKIVNAKLVKQVGNYIYIKGLGRVFISLKNKTMYKYFNLKIDSPKFDLYRLKQSALEQLVNNLFNLRKSEDFKRYLHILKSILKINVANNKISISQNQYRLPFVVKYKVNGRYKEVKINC